MLLAQISDLHIRPSGEKLYDMIDTNALCARHVAFINNLNERVNAVVITGDIVNCGCPDEYAMARRILQQLDCPVYLLPGNHDDNTHFLASFAGLFPYLGNDPEHIAYTVDNLPLRLIFIDSSVDGQLHGKIGQRKLDWLDQTLSKERHRPTIIFTHHHPLPSGCLHMDNIRCQDGEALLELLFGHQQVRWLFCGHTHRAIFMQHQQILLATAPGTAHQVPFHSTDPDGFYNCEPPAMLMHRYSENTGLVSYLTSLAVYDGPFRFSVTPPCLGNI